VTEHALDASGNAMVVWTADHHLWGMRYDGDAGTWSEPTQINDAPGWVASRRSLR
jgi:hypothetical protein